MTRDVGINLMAAFKRNHSGKGNVMEYDDICTAIACAVATGLIAFGIWMVY